MNIPNFTVFRKRLRNYFDRAEKEEVVITRRRRQFVLITYEKYVSLVHGEKSRCST